MGSGCGEESKQPILFPDCTIESQKVSWFSPLVSQRKRKGGCFPSHPPAAVINCDPGCPALPAGLETRLADGVAAKVDYHCREREGVDDTLQGLDNLV